MPNEPEPIQTPKTIKLFARTLGRYLPMRMMQLRTMGKIMRAKTAPKGKR